MYTYLVWHQVSDMLQIQKGKDSCERTWFYLFSVLTLMVTTSITYSTYTDHLIFWIKIYLNTVRVPFMSPKNMQFLERFFLVKAKTNWPLTHIYNSGSVLDILVAILKIVSPISAWMVAIKPYLSPYYLRFTGIILPTVLDHLISSLILASLNPC